MLEELLKHNKLGSGKEILFVLFKAIPAQRSIPVDQLRNYCLSNLFSISQSFDGILKLLCFLSFIEVNEGEVQLSKSYFTPDAFDKKSYFEEVHFFEALFRSLDEQNIIVEMFNLETVRFSQACSQYYILESDFPFKLFSIRNLLIATKFLVRAESYSTQLLIRDVFTQMFKQKIITPLKQNYKQKRKRSLAELKATLKAQEEAGKAAEAFALQYEQSRLKGHSDFEEIQIISEENSTAGYDIESFNSKESIILDRFIEVKSYRDSLSFYWSRNEIEVAKILGGKYHLYLVDRARVNDPNYEPQQFQDPYQKIFLSSLWAKELENFKITFAG